MIYKEKQIPELYDLKHRSDLQSEPGFDWEANLLTRSLSTLLFQNDNVSGFLSQIKNQLVLLFDNFHIIRNWKNYLVDKDYDKHNN